jgi:hypothetical protein
MSQVLCCKCGAEYPVKLFEAIGIGLPIIVCPNCGLVHTVDFQTGKIAPDDDLIHIPQVELKSYYYNGVDYDGGGNDSEVGSNASPPVSQGVDVVDWDTGDYFWVGFLLYDIACNQTPTTSMTVTLLVRKDGGIWETLAASDLALPGTGNMAYTDLTPPNTAWFSSTKGGECSTTDEADGVAQDNGDNLATGVATDDAYRKEFWFAIDPSGASAGGLYEFAIYDSQSLIGTAGSPHVLDASVTIASIGALTIDVSDGLTNIETLD